MTTIFDILKQNSAVNTGSVEDDEIAYFTVR